MATSLLPYGSRAGKYMSPSFSPFVGQDQAFKKNYDVTQTIFNAFHPEYRLLSVLEPENP
jgi:hypothetical protein